MSRNVRLLAFSAAVLAALAVPAAASATSIHWNKAIRIEASKYGGLGAVSCPSSALCVAVDASGYVMRTTKPNGGSWTSPVRIDSYGDLTGVSCPTTALCVAVDSVGNVVTSIDPTAAKPVWSKPVRIDATAAAGGGYAGLAGVSCPSASLCVAVDNAATGNVLVSTDPTGGAKDWKLSALSGVLTSVSCPSTTLCVAAGTQHFYATNPAGGSTAWHATGGPIGFGVLSSIDCSSSSLCVSVGYGNTSSGFAMTSTDPRGSAATWKTASVVPTPPPPGEGVLDAVGCAGTALCVALDGADNAYTTTAPAQGTWSGPAAIRPKSASQTNAISCTTTFCVVVDSAGVETTGVIR